MSLATVPVLHWLGTFVIRTWWFEAALSTVCFVVFISWYWYHERRATQSRHGSLDLARASWTTGPIVQAAVAYWVGIYLWTSLVPPAASYIPDGIPTNTVETVSLLAEVIAGVVAYDAVFFFIHWVMHEIPYLKSWHIRHHELHHRRERDSGLNSDCHVPLESRDTLRHSLIDGSLQVLVNILVQRHTLWGRVKTRLARAVHNVVVIWMLTESHSAAPYPNVWRRWCPGVCHHYQHHIGTSVGRMRYQPFFGYLDEWRWAALAFKDK